MLCQRASISHFETQRLRMVNPKLSLYMVVPVKRSETCATGIQNRTSRSLATCLRNLPLEAHKWLKTLFSIELHRDIQMIDTLGQITTCASMELLKSKPTLWNIPSLPARKATSKDHLREMKMLNLSVMQSLNSIQQLTKRSTWSPETIMLRMTSQEDHSNILLSDNFELFFN